MRKSSLCICENKGTDQLYCHRTSDKHICLGFIDDIIARLPKSDISSLLPSSVDVQSGLCRTLSET